MFTQVMIEVQHLLLHPQAVHYHPPSTMKQALQGKFFTVPHYLLSNLKTTSAAQIAQSPFPFSKANLAITSILLRHGLVSSVSLGDPFRPDPSSFAKLAARDRKIWVQLKYRAGLPVLRELGVVSRGSQRINVNHRELGRMLMGCRAKSIPGVGMGEILIVRVSGHKESPIFSNSKDRIMDGWEAWRKGLSGEIIARAS